MKLVSDANVVISALIADSKTRELIVTLEPDLLTPAFVHDEIENYEDLFVKKSRMEPDRVTQFMDLLFQYIDVVPADDFYQAIERAKDSIEDTTRTMSSIWRARLPTMQPSGAMMLTLTTRI